MDDKNIKEISYLILQSEYLKMLGLDKLSEIEIMNRENEIFIENWFIDLSIDKRIKLLGDAIKSKKRVLEIMDDNTNENIYK